MAKETKKDAKPAYKFLVPRKWVWVWSAIFVPIFLWQLFRGTAPRNYIEAEWAKFTATLHSSSSSTSSSAPVSPARQAEAVPSDPWASVRSLPKSREVPLHFTPGSSELVCNLEKGVWSRQIVTPIESKNYRVEVWPTTDHYFIWFHDGMIARVSNKDSEIKNHGVRRAIFRILVEDPGQTVKVVVDW